MYVWGLLYELVLKLWSDAGITIPQSCVPEVQEKMIKSGCRGRVVIRDSRKKKFVLEGSCACGKVFGLAVGNVSIIFIMYTSLVEPK